MHKVWLGVNVPDDVLALLESQAEVIGPRSDPNPPDSIAGAEEADAAIICPTFPADAATFARLPRLQIVTRTGAGYDNVDVEAATACGICVIRTPDSNTESTAVFTIGMILNAVRRIKLGDHLLCSGRWMPMPEVTAFDLNGATLGIIGLGRIGGRVAEIANVLGMRVIAYDPYIDEGRAVALRTQLIPDLKSVLAQADVVTLHVPLNDETRGMIGAAQMGQMKPGALLVNCARGPILVESALVDALRSGHLAGAALDVWDPEPPALDNPLLDMGNVIATPHMAAKTHEGQRRSRLSGAQQTLMALQGQMPTGLVNPEVWAQHRRF